MFTDMIGRKLNNRYEIIEHIADGSTATLYRALDTRLSREVALKVLLPHIRDASRKRFHQEALAAAQLNHPNIMGIFDIEEDDDVYYLVVEYVEGEPLSHYVPSPPEVVVNLGRQIALALQYAHERQIIHRDVKPANIKVTPDGTVKIMDLGLALPREAIRVTAHGMVIGTPAYLSPEQAQGHPLDHRTDIYSLGVVLYEMATGHLPFEADDISALLIQQVKQPPPPPRLIAPDLPAALEAVILKALEKNPIRRFQSSRAMAEALQASLEAEGVLEQGGEPIQPSRSDTHPVPTMVKPAVPHAQPVIRVILADDHTILRRTLVSFLELRDDIMVVGEAGDGDVALEQTLEHLPDVLVLDLNMPGTGGLDILPRVRSEAPSVKVLVLTGRDEDWYIVQALRAGAHGYLLKSADESELLDGIVKVTEGHLVLGKGVAEKIVTGLLTSKTTEESRLTDTEREILLRVAGGHENEAIARQMQIPVPTIIEGLAHAMNKLGAKDRYGAALQALKRGLISLDDLHNL